MNSKKAKALRKAAKVLYEDTPVQYEPQKYKDIHYKATIEDPVTGKPYPDMETGKPLLLDQVSQQPQPILLRKMTQRYFYQRSKRAA